jgi:2-phospho-L-lactate guanylyltransferase
MASSYSTGPFPTGPSPIRLSPQPAAFALWLIVPVKPFGEGKSRLAALLSSDLRAELSQRWLTHVLTTAVAWGRFAGMAVVSRDAAVLAVASELGALPVAESGDDLNAALAQAREVVIAAGAQAVLALPSDLPLLTGADLDSLHALALTGDSIVIAPSRDGGTNALLMRPPQAIAYAFGLASADRHRALATEAGVPCRLYHSPTLALDIDRPEDLLLVNE